MEGGELFAKISERSHPFTEQGIYLFLFSSFFIFIYFDQIF